MTKINLNLKVGPKFDEAVSFLRLNVIANKEKAQQLADKYKENHQTINDRIIIELHCHYDKQSQLIKHIENFEMLQNFLKRKGILINISKNEKHVLQIVCELSKFDKAYFMKDILDPLGIRDIFQQQSQQVQINLEVNQDMGQIVKILNQTDSFGMAFLHQCRAQIEIDYNNAFPSSVIKVIESIGWEQPNQDFYAAIFGNLANIEINQEFKSCNELPNEIQNYLLRLPMMLFRRGKDRPMKLKIKELDMIEALIGNHMEIKICMMDMGILELDLQGPQMTQFFKNFMGAFDF